MPRAPRARLRPRVTAPTRLAPRERLRAARREVTRTHLLEAAERVFARHGYEEARMKDVAAEAGVALATLYDAHPGKEELYAEIFRVRGGELLRRAAAASVPIAGGAVHRRAPAFTALLAAVGAYVGFLCEHPAYLRIQLLERQPWALMPRFHAEAQRRLWQEGLALSTAVFAAAIAEGSVVDEDPETQARLMISAHQVFLGRWVESGMSEAVTALVARMQAHVERAFRRPTRSVRRRR